MTFWDTCLFSAFVCLLKCLSIPTFDKFIRAELLQPCLSKLVSLPGQSFNASLPTALLNSKPSVSPPSESNPHLTSLTRTHLFSLHLFSPPEMSLHTPFISAMPDCPQTRGSSCTAVLPPRTHTYSAPQDQESHTAVMNSPSLFLPCLFLQLNSTGNRDTQRLQKGKVMFQSMIKVETEYSEAFPFPLGGSHFAGFLTITNKFKMYKFEILWLWTPDFI